MTRVLHTADTHVGYQQYHSPARREDFLDAFRQVVADAVEADVDAVVHAGDLFHDRRPELPDLLGTIEALRDLDDADVPFLAVVGNHESTRHAQWLDLFERLGLAERLTDEPRRVGDVAFYGLDHVPTARRDDLDHEFDPTDAEYVALVAHGIFEPFAHADWETEALLDDLSVDVDAMLLGDNHAPGTERVDGTWVTYPGSTERASASEREGRGYNLVAFDDGVDVRRRALDTREFVFVDIELAGDEGVDRVRERVTQHDLTDAVVVVTVEGEGEPIAPAGVEETALEAGALVARVTDRRTVDDDDHAEVSFADPDDAVRERLDEMALSPAAVDIDRVVRDLDVPDSNVRETVERRIEDRLDEGLDGFEPGDGRGEEPPVAGQSDDEPADDADDSQVTMGDYT